MKARAIYLAHQISGSSYEAVNQYYTDTTQVLEGWGWDVLHPMVGKGQLRTETKFKAHGYDNVPMAANHAIFERDKWMVTQADVVYAHLVGMTTISIGMMMELAWASLLGKYTIVAMEPENIHQHAFVLEAADLILPSHEEVMAYLQVLSGGEEV